MAETWLVLCGAGLLAAFPKAYALILLSPYLPVLLMLVALVLHGVAFEVRFKAVRAKRAWGRIGFGTWPYLVPPAMTIWDAASPPSSQGFVLVGLIVLLPAILGYTWWAYSVFRGKVAADAGYH